MKPYDPKLSDAENLATDNTNEGEGSRTASRRYNADVRAFVASDHAATDAAARAAASTIGTPTGEADRAAADQTAARGTPSIVDRVKGMFHRARNRARQALSARS